MSPCDGDKDITKIEMKMLLKINQQKAEIEKLQKQLNNTVSIETVIATEAERDEARNAARDLWRALLALLQTTNTSSLKSVWIKQFPWLEEVADE